MLEKHPETVFVKNTNEQIAVDGQDDEDDNATVSVFDLFDGTEEIRPFATPRTIDGVSRYLNVLSFDKITSLMATPSVTRDGRNISYLQEVIEGLTGNTSFTTLLMGIISDELSKGSTGTQNAQRVVKPRIYNKPKLLPLIPHNQWQLRIHKGIVNLTIVEVRMLPMWFLFCLIRCHQI